MPSPNPTAPSAATAFGSHFHSQWDRCPRQFWLARKAPHPTISGGRGLRPSWTAEPLLLGDAFHIGLASYYQTGYADGQYKADKAVRDAEDALNNRRGEWRSAEAFTDTAAKVRQLLWNYDEFYGPAARVPDYPDLRIFCDAEGPVIEREFSVEFERGFPPFTCRVDALVHFQGWLWVFEHKTTSASGVRSLQSSMRTAIQGTGECYVLHKLFPELPIQGVLLNIVVKDRGSRSREPSFYRDPIARTPGQLEQFEWDLRNRLNAMRRADEVYERWLAQCGDPWEAARHSYIAAGTSNGSCMAYNRPCDFLDLCAGAGHEQMFASGFNAASTPETPERIEERASAE